MSISSFSTALSALAATSTAVDVVGNNLANLETTGFKASSVQFQDLVTQSFGSGIGSTQVGFGVGRPITLRDFSQGALQTSSGPLDCAIQGDGFLIVKNSVGATLYNRGGSLQVDKDGNLLTVSGEHIQGWNAAADGTLNPTGPVSDLVVPVGTVKPPVASQNFSFDFNLNAAGTAGPPPTTFSSSIQVFDSLGAPHVVTVDYTKSATANQWDYSISVPDADVTAPIAPVTGSLTFDSQGKLLTPAATDTMPAIAITGLVDGAADMNLTWSLYNGAAPRVTQFTQTSAVSANAQDGSPPTQLTQIKLGDGGTLLAQYSDGTQITVGQLAMASIRNPQSLTAVGKSDFQLSELSAVPAVGLPGTGGRGDLLGGSLESSNVDIATEFTRLIVFQRGYQANAKVITATDEITQATIALKQ
jgi:flagellar hook protein FlgE